MRIVAFGDSFTNGLIKLPKRYTQEESHQNSFVNKMFQSSKIFTDYSNLADNGCGNRQIASKIYKCLLEKKISKNDFVFIGWSSLTRTALWDNEYYKTPDNNVVDYKQLIYDTESSILSTHMILKLQGIRHCMIQAFHDYSSQTDIKYLLEKNINFPCWINFQKNNNTLMDICMLRYLSEAKFKDIKNHHKEKYVQHTKYLAECYHPNDAGHRLIAETLRPIAEIYATTDKSLEY